MTIRNRFFILFMMLGAFLVAGQLYLALPLLNVIAFEYHVTEGQAVMVISLFGIAYAIGFLFFGPLSDKLGKKRVILGGLIATAITTLILSFAKSFDMVLLGRILQGFIAASFPPAALSLIATQLPQNKRAIGISSISLAFLSAAPLIQFLVVRSGLSFSAILTIMAPLYTAVMLGLLICCDKDQKQQKSKSASFSTLFKDVGIWTIWLVAFTVLFSFVYFYSGAQMKAASQGINVQALRLLSLIPLLLALTAPVIIKKYGAPQTAFLGLVLILFALLSASFNIASTWMIASVLMSAGVAYALPGLIDTTANRSAPHTRSTAMAIYSFALFIGASLSAPLAQFFITLNPMLFWLFPIALTAIGAIALLSIKMQPIAVT